MPEIIDLQEEAMGDDIVVDASVPDATEEGAEVPPIIPTDPLDILNSVQGIGMLALLTNDHIDKDKLALMRLLSDTSNKQLRTNAENSKGSAVKELAAAIAMNNHGIFKSNPFKEASTATTGSDVSQVTHKVDLGTHEIEDQELESEGETIQYDEIMSKEHD